MTVAFSLGLRLAKPRRYVDWLQAFTVAMVVALGCLSACAFVSAHNILESQNRVTVARAPHQPNVLPPGETLAKIAVVEDRWDGTPISRVILVAGATRSVPVPPGVPRAPGPGEAFVSPAVWALRGTNAPAWLAVGSQRVVGLISQEGLVDPSEERIIVGSTREASRRAVLSEFDGFGDSNTPGLVSLTGPLGFLAAAALCLVFGGLLFAAALAVRLREGELVRRDRLLSALGVGPIATRLIT